MSTIMPTLLALSRRTTTSLAHLRTPPPRRTPAVARFSTPATSSQPKITKFWKQVHLHTNRGAFTVKLDNHRLLKTPAGIPISIPANLPVLAHFLAAEWEAQSDTLKSYSLPITSIVVRALDDFADSDTRNLVVSQLLKYLHTDSICYHQTFPQPVVDLQSMYWTPIIKWAESHYQTRISVQYSILNTARNVPPPHRVLDEIDRMTAIQLASFEKLVLTTKSVWIALAVMNRFIDARHAAIAARVEVLAQIDQWGLVLDAHDVDHAQMQSVLAACALALN